MAYKIKKVKLKTYKIRDIYGDEYQYKTQNKKEAKEYFEIENGDRFGEFVK